MIENHPSFNAKTFNEVMPLVRGDILHGFRVVHVEPVPEFDLFAVCLEHDRTGAKYLHIARDDDNNVFSVAFPTFPKDSTGVAHILEHTALCGSEKYPVRDPFFKMLNRSLATFMNAWTASDYTMVRGGIYGTDSDLFYPFFIAFSILFQAKIIRITQT